MSTLEQAIKQEQWELVALLLALGLLRTLEEAVPDTLPEILALLEEPHD